MDLALDPRPGSPLRCAGCHDLLADPVACPGCGAVLHPDCLADLARCPTLGCGDRGSLRAKARRWRLSPERAEVVPYPGDPERDILLLSCTTYGSTITQECFGVTPDERLTLVRLQREDGTAGLVNYTCPCHRIGPAPPRQTTTAWKAALASDDPVELLEALLWLSGTHDEEASCDPDAPIGSDLETVTSLREDPAVTALVLRLVGSRDRWVAETAAHALAACRLAQDTTRVR
jgi:hypothetical protein